MSEQNKVDCQAKMPSSTGKYMTRAEVWRHGRMIGIQDHLREFDGESFSLAYMEEEEQESHYITNWWEVE